MAVSTKIIKRRIKSIGNTRKITKAMEMISAVKMRKAVANVLATRSYSNLAWEMLTEIGKKTDVSLHPLLQKRDVKRIGLILITSNRGLAGGFSSRLFQATHDFVVSSKAKYNAEVDIILTGNKGRKIYQKYGHNIIAQFEKLDLTKHINDVLPLAHMLIKDYSEGKYDMVVVAYTDFASPLRQTPKLKQILPLQNESKIEVSEDNFKKPEAIHSEYGYKFEPNPKNVLDVLLPRLVEMQMYQAVLESDASEHSSRMMAMRNASDSAKEIIKELQYSFNKARQASITQEISEIVGGAAALE